MYDSIRPEKGDQLNVFVDDYCVLDLETTGLRPLEDSITEIGAVKIVNNQVVDSFSTLLKPDITDENGDWVSPKITEITHITNNMLSKAPASKLALGDFYEWIGDMIVVGHNVNFDINFLYHQFEKYLDKPFKNDYIDTMSLYKQLQPNREHHRLLDLCKDCKVINNQAHRALSDVYATQECFEVMHKLVYEKVHGTSVND